ncbi:MFS transporter [Xenophilus aerolatus]|nr:MFS transporter [Xenophilus aerolatus]
MPSAPLAVTTSPRSGAAPTRSRVLWLSCVAHALHDGYTDMIYVLLPVWQAEFGLGYGALAVLRGLYGGTMAALQLPAGWLAQRIGTRATLALGTLLAAVGYAAAGMTGSLVGLGLALALAGSGSSTQHPLASGAVARAYGQQARGPLGVYNFAGDLGKAALPAALALLITLAPWRPALWAMSALGVAVAVCLALFLPKVPVGSQAAHGDAASAAPGSPTGFRLLLAIGVLDTAVRMGLLTFLPFLLQAKGIPAPLLGVALALVFLGGAAGKFVCGWLGARLGVTGTVLATEGGSALGIVALLLCPLSLAWVLLPLLGAMLNGTSSVLYGTVPELAQRGSTERAFAIFYTGVIASGALSPVLYGLLGDRVGIELATCATVLTALAILPMALALRPRLVRAAVA